MSSLFIAFGKHFFFCWTFRGRIVNCALFWTWRCGGKDYHLVESWSRGIWSNTTAPTTFLACKTIQLRKKIPQTSFSSLMFASCWPLCSSPDGNIWLHACARHSPLPSSLFMCRVGAIWKLVKWIIKTIDIFSALSKHHATNDRRLGQRCVHVETNFPSGC